jgi:hypothetical protein
VPGPSNLPAQAEQRNERRATSSVGSAGVYLALTNEPQSTTAWAQDSRGERLLGEYQVPACESSTRLISLDGARPLETVAGEQGDQLRFHLLRVRLPLRADRAGVSAGLVQGVE